MRSQTNELFLVYPPLSNQEADWLQDVPEARSVMTSSKLYMIGHRPQLYFANFRCEPHNGKVMIFLEVVQAGLGVSLPFALPLEALLPGHIGTLDLEFGEELLRIWPEHRRDGDEPLIWLTPNRLLYMSSRSQFGEKHKFDVRPLMTFDLLYVGISLRSDSFSRLFDTGHQARTSILSNETQRYPESRLTDELTIFFFDIASLGIRVIDESNYDKVGEDFRPEPLKVVADAEKAFVSMLKPRYNTIRFHKYPESIDGLWDEKLTGYSYAVAEELVFVTPLGEIRGGLDHREQDAIVVVGNTVEFFKGSRPSDTAGSAGDPSRTN